MERRLAAILVADVVGYTRLMGDDEAGTLRRLTKLRERVLGPLISDHRGRVDKLMGDGLLIEFASLVDAVGCAVVWQLAVAQHETEQNEDSRLSFRNGINLGDVIVEGEDIYGDGVNVAARLEGLADPGGICVARNVFDQVKSTLPVPVGVSTGKGMERLRRGLTGLLQFSTTQEPVPTTQRLPWHLLHSHRNQRSRTFLTPRKSAALQASRRLDPRQQR